VSFITSKFLLPGIINSDKLERRSTMAIRSIVHIDEDKCNGCGLCVPSCAEGAIKIIDGKARLISDKYCDGLGACLGTCPQGAITIIEREAEDFDEEAVKNNLQGTTGNSNHDIKFDTCNTQTFTCPGSKPINLSENKKSASASETGDISISIKSQLKQWPVQLMLVPIKASYFENADLLIAADCVAVAYPNYHLGMLKGKTVVIGCPKLDDGSYYVEKLSAILKNNNIKSLTVAHMEVPCCFGMVKIAEEALRKSGKNIPLKTIEIGIEGEIIG